jgi:hypothetical protein
MLLLFHFLKIIHHLQKIAENTLLITFFVAIEKKQGYATFAHYGFHLKFFKLVVK